MLEQKTKVFVRKEDIDFIFENTMDMEELCSCDLEVNAVKLDIFMALREKEFALFLENLADESKLFELENILTRYGYRPEWLNDELHYTYDDYTHDVIESTKSYAFLQDKLITVNFPNGKFQTDDLETLINKIADSYTSFTDVIIEPLGGLTIYTNSDTINLDMVIDYKE